MNLEELIARFGFCMLTTEAMARRMGSKFSRLVRNPKVGCLDNDLLMDIQARGLLIQRARRTGVNLSPMLMAARTYQTYQT